jgi:hypothetical protein
VLVGVWDQGQGIPAGKLSLVFEEFQRLSEHSAMCSKGLGLGLAIVKRLATRLQHRLVVRHIMGAALLRHCAALWPGRIRQPHAASAGAGGGIRPIRAARPVGAAD